MNIHIYFTQKTIRCQGFLSNQHQKNLPQIAIFHITHKEIRREPIWLSPYQVQSPPDRVNENRETLQCKVVSYPKLYCSQRPAIFVKTSQLRKKEGGLQTISALLYRTPFSNCRFFKPIHHAPSRLLPFLKERQTKELQPITLCYRFQMRRNLSPVRKDHQNSLQRRQTRRHHR